MSIHALSINDFNLIAFLGTPEDERYAVVFTSEALIAWPGLVLEDDNTVVSIVYAGGNAINDLGEVAFHGEVYWFNGLDNDSKAVFTQHGVVARMGGLLTDETLVSDIDESGGVAINMFGEVVFHGDVLKEGSDSETVRAEFKSSVSAALFYPDNQLDGEEITMLLMPIRLSS